MLPDSSNTINAQFSPGDSGGGGDSHGHPTGYPRTNRSPSAASKLSTYVDTSHNLTAKPKSAKMQMVGNG